MSVDTQPAHSTNMSIDTRLICWPISVTSRPTCMSVDTQSLSHRRYSNTLPALGQFSCFSTEIAFVLPTPSTHPRPAHYTKYQYFQWLLSLTVHAGTTDGRSPVKMTGQIHFNSDILHFWPVNVIFHKYTIYLPTPDGQHQWHLW